MKFLDDIIEHNRLPDWIESSEVFSLVSHCSRVSPPDPNHLPLLDFPPLDDDRAAESVGYNTVDQLRGLGDRFQWRKRWQENHIALNRLLQKRRPAYLAAKKISDTCGAFLARMAQIGVANHTPQQTADIQTKTQAKANADIIIAQHQPYIDAIQLLVEDEFDFPEGFMNM